MVNLWYYVVESLLFVDNLVDAGPGPIELCPEELFSDDALGHADSVTVEGFVLGLFLLPSDLLQTEVHYFSVETQAFSDVHIKYINSTSPITLSPANSLDYLTPETIPFILTSLPPPLSFLTPLVP